MISTVVALLLILVLILEAGVGFPEAIVCY